MAVRSMFRDAEEFARVKHMASVGAERFPDAELFVWDGELDEFARRAFRRVQADLMYLSLRPHTPRAEAGRLVCARWGHEPRGRQCLRCGAPVA
jgi:hypothetical protein